MGSGHRVGEQGPSQVGKSGPCEGPACKAPSRLPCPCRAQPWVLKAQTWILLSFASVARTTGHMKTGDPQGTMPLWPLGRDLPPHLGTWPSHVRALPASFKPSCPHPAPNPDHWEPTLPCPCPTLLLSVASEVSTTALTVDQCFHQAQHSPGTGEPMAWATPRPLTSPGHMASAGAIPSPPFSLQAGLGPWGSSPGDTCASLASSALHSSPANFRGGGVREGDAWPRGSQAVESEVSGATGQWAMNYSEIPDARLGAG